MGLNEKFFKSAAGGITASDNFVPVLYTGNWNGSNTNTVEVGFRPDWIWIKRRDGADSHHLYDSVRGMGKVIQSNNTGTENQSNHVNTTSTGFTLVTDNVNQNGNLFIAWCWKAGGAASSNTDGSITSQVSANTDAGFSIVKWTGNGTNNATIGHGLSQAPELLLGKNLVEAGNWMVLSSALSSNNDFLILNTTSAKLTSSNVTFSPTSTTFGLQAGQFINQNNKANIAYAFHSIAGYQKIGSYQGDDSTNESNIINVGFQPSFVMVKNITSGSTSWVIADDERGYADLYANVADAEFASGSLYGAHFTSVGFTFATADISRNASNNTYIYLAIA